MEIGIFGLPLSGKTTLFNLLTNSSAETGFASSKKKANMGISKVPDARLDELKRIWSPKKTTYTTVNYVDVAGVEKGGEKGLSSDVMTSLKNTDALLVVVRQFASDMVPHPEESIDPKRDVSILTSEMLLSDLVIVETRLERIAKQMKGKVSDEVMREKELMEKLQAILEEERPLRDVELSADEIKIIKGFQFLTLKPLIVVINTGEEDIADGDALASELTASINSPKVAVTHLCAEIEQEISQLSPEEATEFLADLGIEEPATARIIRTSYELLGLISFFTMGEDECRAWTVERGAKAPRAAGVIHSDLERGFIRAEVVSYENFVSAGSLAACRDKGLLSTEGKEYVVKDGDILNIRFNV
ncbi:MAG: redox-regulated ATPase YchF [Deltaproteobacteria bacterium]|nr:MAG: redox-regulated ATPase YchF [Deltaproteobacteria bacterium]